MRSPSVVVLCIKPKSTRTEPELPSTQAIADPVPPGACCRVPGGTGLHLKTCPGRMIIISLILAIAAPVRERSLPVLGLGFPCSDDKQESWPPLPQVPDSPSGNAITCAVRAARIPVFHRNRRKFPVLATLAETSSLGTAPSANQSAGARHFSPRPGKG